MVYNFYVGQEVDTRLEEMGQNYKEIFIYFLINKDFILWM